MLVLLVAIGAVMITSGVAVLYIRHDRPATPRTRLIEITFTVSCLAATVVTAIQTLSE